MTILYVALFNRRNHRASGALCLALLALLFAAACRSTSKKPPARPVVTPDAILGSGKIHSRSLASFLLAANPALDKAFAEDFAALYVEEAAAEGINHDVAFSQMCVETGFLAYGGLVTPDMNNFCGLGSIGPGQPGERFPSPRIGIRAQIQHLKAYATSEPPKLALVDPRYHWVKQGSAPTIDALAGKWAADREYGVKIKHILERLYRSAQG
jgi:hypothetical protein